MLPNQEKLDPRVKRTRALILNAFQDLLAEKNFEAITVQDVTTRAQINRATFYAHFQDKYALLDYSIAQMFMGEIEKRMLNLCRYSPDNLRNLILGVCEFLRGSTKTAHNHTSSLNRWSRRKLSSSSSPCSAIGLNRPIDPFRARFQQRWQPGRFTAWHHITVIPRRFSAWTNLWMKLYLWWRSTLSSMLNSDHPSRLFIFGCFEIIDDSLCRQAG